MKHDIARVAAEDTFESEFGNFISFRLVTLVPFEPKLIRWFLQQPLQSKITCCLRYSKLSPEQIEWLNSYNEQIKADVVPRWENKSDIWNDTFLRLEQSGDQLGLYWTRTRTEHVSPRLSHVFSDFWVFTFCLLKHTHTYCPPYF